MNEKWSDKYKKSIDCSNPKGFSQKAHCQGRKKSLKELRQELKEYVGVTYGVGIGPVDTIKPMASMGSQGQFFPNKKYRGLYATYQGPGFGTYNPTSSLNTKREYFSQPRTIGKSGYGPAHPLNPKNKPSLMTKLKHMWQKKEDTKRIPRKEGQPAGSDKHSDLYTDENPKGTIHGLGFTDGATAKKSVSKIKNSGRSHAHKIQAAIAMSQRAKVASERAKDPEKKKDLKKAHEIYQSFIDKNKKDK
jgi:hypothetical protein